MKYRTVYCHFSFRRPKGQSEFGYFSAAVYNDFNAKYLLAQTTRKLPLWENTQFVTAVQSYENVLHCIHEWQGMMFRKNIRQVMLVTDNSILAGWILDPGKNKNYAEYMERAIYKYRCGGPKEITIGIGLCKPWERERSYKFCNESKVKNIYRPPQLGLGNKKVLEIGDESGIKTVFDVMDSITDSSAVITGINTVG